MKLYLKKISKNILVEGEYDPIKKIFIIFKGAKVSEEVSTAPHFRGAKKILFYRKKYTRNGIVTSDVTFRSPSTAANFITGTSTNGLIAWKSKQGVTLREMIKG